MPALGFHRGACEKPLDFTGPADFRAGIRGCARIIQRGRAACGASDAAPACTGACKGSCFAFTDRVSDLSRVGKLDTLSADPVSEVPESAYRYVLYEAHGAARMLYAYGILGQQYLSGCWTTIAITAPFSNNRSGVVRLTKLCTDQQLEPIHILDVIHDFMDLETRPF